MTVSSHALATRSGFPGRSFSDYLTLTKPEVTGLVLVATLAGFYLASPGGPELVPLLLTLAGTGLVAAGTATLNQFLERVIDGRMRRTASRPLPARRLQPARALWFGIGLAVTGTVVLALGVNLRSSLLAALTLTSYLLLYTPLKTRSVWCTFVGAFPGAMPPLIGWAAARGTLEPGAWVLFTILFLWQFPHFLAIAWLYREDYARGGIVMTPVVDSGGRATGRQVVLCSAVLLPVSLLPTLLGMAGWVYLVGAFVLSAAFLAAGVGLAVTPSNRHARYLLQASILYLPLLFSLLMLDRRVP